MVMAQTSSKGKVVSRDKKPNYNQLPLEEREKLLKPYLPLPRDRTRSQDRQATHSKHAPSSAVQSLFSLSFNDLLKLLIHKLLFHLIQLVFSIYIRIRQTYHAVRELIFSVLYYHNRTPEFIQKDVKGLSRLPRHLSVIVDLRAQGSKEAVQRLMHDVAELAAWCACAGIEMLSVYEKTGKYCRNYTKLVAAMTAALTSDLSGLLIRSLYADTTAIYRRPEITNT